MKMMMVIMKERPKQSLSDEGIHIYCCQLIGGWHDSWGVAEVLPCALLFSFSHLIMMPILNNFDKKLDKIGWVISMTLGGWPRFCPVRFHSVSEQQTLTGTWTGSLSQFYFSQLQFYFLFQIIH